MGIWLKISSSISMLLLFACDSRADSFCEALFYNNNTIMLSIPEEYYALPRFRDSMISVRLRYRDLGAAGKLKENYDPSELESPDWSLENTSKTALLQVHRRRNVQWPSSLSELQERNPGGRPVTSDWEGWIKFVECRTNCGSVSYVSADWQPQGVAYVRCSEMIGWNPLLQGCTAFDRLDGILVEYSFPEKKKAHFSEFRDRIREILSIWRLEGRRSCSSEN